MTTTTDMEMLVEILETHTETIGNNIKVIERLLVHIDSLVDRVDALEINALAANDE